MELSELQGIAAEIRGKIIEMSHTAKTPHLGSSLSCVDLIVAAYWHGLRIDPKKPTDFNRDRFILSKGHAATTLYAVLAKRGFFGADVLDSYNKPGGVLQEHPGVGCAPGIEAATGSLGHGLPIGVGLALGARAQGADYRVMLVMSDGECNEGSVWEAAMLAASQKLNNIIAFIDYNKWQATDRSNEVMALAPFREKWASFGWDAHEIDGHDMGKIIELMDMPPDADGRPRVVIANTVKGKGVSFMEDDNNWHYRVPNEEELGKARQELGLV